MCIIAELFAILQQSIFFFVIQNNPVYCTINFDDL